MKDYLALGGRWPVWVFLAGTLLTGPRNLRADEAARPAATAQAILQATGVKGGLIVHLGCGNGKLTAALRAGDGYLVHGLDADARGVEQARALLRARGLYGPVSVERFDGRHLPYADNLVNLIIAEELGQVSGDEVMRVLAPRGVAYLKRGGRWEKTVKPWPAEIDEWTHWLHGADNNAVARDTRVGPPRRMQWIAGPLWGRGHEVVTTVGALVTARGRIFYVLDQGQTGIYTLPSKWSLVARDAFNGVPLWNCPIPGWGPPTDLGGFTRGFRPRRLVTDGDRVWLPMGEDAILTALDAATGRTVKTLDAGRGATEILCADGVLTAVIGARTDAAAKRKGAAAGGGPRLLAVSTDSLEPLWNAPAAGLVADTLARSACRVFHQAGNRLVALDARTGRPAWQAPLEGPSAKKPRRPGPSRLMAYRGQVYFHSGVQLAAFSADTGKLLWERKDAPSGQGALFAAADLLWRTEDQQVIGYDPATGEVRRTIDATAVFTPGHHPRCYPSKATERYVIANNRGAEFVSLDSNEHVENDWLRGNCGHGVMPANGLLYVPPNPCFCYHGVKLTSLRPPPA